MSYYDLAARSSRDRAFIRWAASVAAPSVLWTSLFLWSLWHRSARCPGCGARRPLTETLVHLPRALPERVTFAVALFLSCATVIGFLARIVGSQLEDFWLAVRWQRLTAPLTALRKKRWNTADGKAEKAEREDPETFKKMSAKRIRIGLSEPCRATWMGDRYASLETRVLNQYELDFASAWPRLWLVLPEHCRAEAGEAAVAWRLASLAGAWGVLFAALGFLWPPAFILGGVVLVRAVSQGRAAAETFTDFAEAAVNLHALTLARALGLDGGAERFEPEMGQQINNLLRMGG